MGMVTVDISMSLDGFITGPGDGVDSPLGAGGERLHEWVYGLESWRERHGQTGGETNRDAEILEEAFATTGAALMGRRMFDVGEGPWGDEPPSTCRCSLSRTTAGKNWPRRAAPRSPSLPMASRAPSIRHGRPPRMGTSTLLVAATP